MARKQVLTLNSEQLDCLRSPIRSEILSWLISDGPMTVSELCRITGYLQKSLYYPIRKLEACQLVQSVSTSYEGARPEQQYDACMDNMELPKRDPSTQMLANKALIGIMSVALREVARAANSDKSHSIGIFCHRNVVRLGESDREELVKKLKEISDFIRDRADNDSPPFSLTTALVPRIAGSKQKQNNSRSKH